MYVHILKVCALFLALTVGPSAISQKQPGQKTQLLNKSLIFDLYMNFELANKNENLAALTDYLNSADNFKGVTVKTKSNIGNDIELITKYETDGKLSKLIFKVFEHPGERNYSYTFEYKGELLDRILLNGKLKFELKYSKKGKILSISRLMKENLYYILHFIYKKDNTTAELRFDVLDNGKFDALDASGFVKWNKKQKLTDYSIYKVYTSSNIKYHKNGAVSSLDFEGSFGNTIHHLIWNYEPAKKKMWTKRTAEKIYFERSLVINE